MGGIGHGDHEATGRKKEEDKRRFLSRDFSNLESLDTGFEGTISSTNMPEKIEFIHQDDSQARDQKESTSTVYENAEELEIQYELLSPSELNGLALLEAVETGGAMSEFSPELVELMHGQGLIENTDQELQTTSKGKQAYSNWTGFRDNYLTGNSDESRFDVIESEMGVTSIPWFLEETSDVEITLDQYLRRKEQSRSKYNPESEFESVLSSLHGHGQDELGDHVRALEVLSNPEDYDNQEISEDLQREFRNATALGLLDDNGVLTQDGEALYRKVRADSYYLNW